MLGPTPLVPQSFEIPLRVETELFTLRPLTLDRFYLDYECYMSSIEHLQRTFDLDGDPIVQDGAVWPANSDLEFAVIDAAWCHMEWKFFRSSFTYTALDKRERRQLGCGYIFPCHKEGYDILCETWIRSDQLDTHFGQVFPTWFRDWVNTAWPFADRVVGWPGVEITWEAWNEIPNKVGAGALADG